MSSTISVPNLATVASTPVDLAQALILVATAAKADVNALLSGGVVGAVGSARGVVTANVASLASFTVAGNDGITYAAGDVVLLVGQTTAAQNGPYVVGTVGGGTAPLTRPTWWAAGAGIPLGAVVEVGGEGTSWKNSTWKATCVKGKLVDTDDPLFFPRKQSGVSSAMAGTPGTKTISNIWLLATSSHVDVVADTPAGTQGILSVPVASKTAGAGTGSFVVNSTANETSTLSWQITNW